MAEETKVDYGSWWDRLCDQWHNFCVDPDYTVIESDYSLEEMEKIVHALTTDKIADQISHNRMRVLALQLCKRLIRAEAFIRSQVNDTH